MLLKVVALLMLLKVVTLCYRSLKVLQIPILIGELRAFILLDILTKKTWETEMQLHT